MRRLHGYYGAHVLCGRVATKNPNPVGLMRCGSEYAWETTATLAGAQWTLEAESANFHLIYNSLIRMVLSWHSGRTERGA